MRMYRTHEAIPNWYGQTVWNGRTSSTWEKRISQCITLWWVRILSKRWCHIRNTIVKRTDVFVCNHSYNGKTCSIRKWSRFTKSVRWGCLAVMLLAADPIIAVAAETDASDSLPLLPRIEVTETTVLLALLLLHTISEISRTGSHRRPKTCKFLASWRECIICILLPKSSILKFQLMFHLYQWLIM